MARHVLWPRLLTYCPQVTGNMYNVFVNFGNFTASHSLVTGRYKTDRQTHGQTDWRDA